MVASLWLTSSWISAFRISGLSRRVPTLAEHGDLWRLLICTSVADSCIQVLESVSWSEMRCRILRLYANVGYNRIYPDGKVCSWPGIIATRPKYRQILGTIRK